MDAALIATVSKLHDLNVDEYALMMTAGMARITSSSSQQPAPEDDIEAAIVEALATLFWEVSKIPPRVSQASRADLLRQAGLSAAVVDAFMIALRSNSDALLELKRSFAPHKPSYKDLAWRLDVEVARRNAHVLVEPVYMLRLDLTQPRLTPSPDGRSVSNSDGPTATTSLHLQADHANLRRLQDELQKASDALHSAHCQRLTRYIS